MQKPDEKLLAAVRSLSIAERTYLAAYLDILATGEDNGGRKCSRCGAVGHRANKCPEAAGNQEVLLKEEQHG